MRIGNRSCLVLALFLALLAGGCGGGDDVTGARGAGALSVNPTDCASMVWVPGGSVTMGTEYNASWDAPLTKQATLSGFWIYKYEVTVAQYRAFCTATSRALPEFPSDNGWAGKNGWDNLSLQQHPIVNVSWDNAKAYADWAGVSLPTEAQWEYASRGPSGKNYPWGGTATALDPINGWDNTKCANAGNSLDVNISTWPVGSFPGGASWCGAQDLAGNAWEWCADWYGAYSLTPVIDPTGAASGTERVLRGGSWYNHNQNAFRGANRNNGRLTPESWNSHLGFRCVSITP